MTLGRPILYKAEFCNIAEELLKEGASIEEIGLELNCGYSTVYHWMETYPDFLEAIKRGREHSKGWWLREGRKNLKDKDFSPTLWYMNMKNRWGWTDKNESNHNVTVKHEEQITDLE